MRTIPILSSEGGGQPYQQQLLLLVVGRAACRFLESLAAFSGLVVLEVAFAAKVLS